MKVSLFALLGIVLTSMSVAQDDTRQFVEMPQMMQEHMMMNMRSHLSVINEIINLIADNELDQAAIIAEKQLGMSSMNNHNASHMAHFMPEGMKKYGTALHQAASRFALKAEEGDMAEAVKSLAEVTSVCVACHSSYKIR